MAIPGGEKLDFRDVEILPNGPGSSSRRRHRRLSRIYRTTDGGKTWTLGHTNPDKDGFYDAMAFWDAKSGVVLGDPVKGRFVMPLTSDGGYLGPAAPGRDVGGLSGPGAFAASGTCLTLPRAVRGLVRDRRRPGVACVPQLRPREARGARAPDPVPPTTRPRDSFRSRSSTRSAASPSAATTRQPALAGLNGARTEDGGRTWKPAPITDPDSSRPVVAVPGAAARLVAVGPTGTAVSDDRGTWAPARRTPLNAVAFSDANTGWAVGPRDDRPVPRDSVALRDPPRTRLSAQTGCGGGRRRSWLCRNQDSA